MAKTNKEWVAIRSRATAAMKLAVADARNLCTLAPGFTKACFPDKEDVDHRRWRNEGIEHLMAEADALQEYVDKGFTTQDHKRIYLHVAKLLFWKERMSHIPSYLNPVLPKVWKENDKVLHAWVDCEMSLAAHLAEIPILELLE